MPGSEDFVDYYELLQLQPGCDIKVIESAYRHLAKMYHPDHEETADLERFTKVIDAYNTLKFPEKRARYDALYEQVKGGHRLGAEALLNSETATSDAVMQKNLLLYLYKHKRENFRELGIGPYQLQEHFGCSDDLFGFHVWYLKSKGFVEITEDGTLTITAKGVDKVISIHQPRDAERLLTDQSNHD